MGSLEEPLRRLAECEAGLMDKWGWGRDYYQRVATAPEMRDPQLWFFKAIIYPAVQNLTRVSSFLQLRLKVDAGGRVAECVVQSSPGSSQFGGKELHEASAGRRASIPPSMPRASPWKATSRCRSPSRDTTKLRSWTGVLRCREDGQNISGSHAPIDDGGWAG